LNDAIDGSLHALAHFHRIHASRNILKALDKDGTGENGSCGGTVTRHLIGFVGDVLN
jgi:hypothetical protein